MSVSEDFKQFLEGIKIDNAETISMRYGEITAALNKKFRTSESKNDNTLQVGSYGRYTAIRGISDLDMVYIMPKGRWELYKNEQSQLLKDVKEAILARYPKTDVKVDRLVVVVTYKDFQIEVQPAFEREDGGFDFPDTYNGGSWCITKPKAELKAMSDVNSEKNGNLRPLCKMTRAWKNKHGVVMGGLLIDTLAHNFLKLTDFYDNKGPLYYDFMCRDFFKYLSELPKQEWFSALGSGQRVYVKKNFKHAAQKAYDLCVKAIEDDNNNEKWRKVFGRAYPQVQKLTALAENARKWRDTEEFIGDKLPVDIRYHMEIECEVSQNGFREYVLSHMLRFGIPLQTKKKLLFSVSEIEVPPPYMLKWKVRNRGPEAERLDCIRGQILDDHGHGNRNESTSFLGEHLVECYAVKSGVVVARADIYVPIS